MNLGVEAEFAGDEKRDRKSSPKVRRKFVGALNFETSALDHTSGGSRNGPYFRIQRVEGYAGIYIVLGFWVDGKTTYFIIFGIN